MGDYQWLKDRKVASVEQADGYCHGKYHRHLKVSKRRIERRRAKRNPECQPGYGRYNGYES